MGSEWSFFGISFEAYVRPRGYGGGSEVGVVGSRSHLGVETAKATTRWRSGRMRRKATVLSFEGAEQRQGACSDEINRQHRFRVLE